jgi:hypothetical protein
MKEIFISGTEPQSPCSLHKQKPFSQTEETSMPIGDSPPGSLAIIFPRDGDTFKIDPILRRTFQTLQFKIAVSDNFPAETVEWWINDRKETVTSPPFSYAWKIKPGLYTITAFARSGQKRIRSREVKIWVLL